MNFFSYLFYPANHAKVPYGGGVGGGTNLRSDQSARSRTPIMRRSVRPRARPIGWSKRGPKQNRRGPKQKRRIRVVYI